jgi:hypothetical protein
MPPIVCCLAHRAGKPAAKEQGSTCIRARSRPTKTCPALPQCSGLSAVAPARGATRLVDLAQSGSARILLPRVAGPVPEAVFLNTSGGLTSGDRLSYAMSVADHGHLTATTQTAERAYLATSGSASLSITAEIGATGWLDWLPHVKPGPIARPPAGDFAGASAVA